jgi:hypothetical protein
VTLIFGRAWMSRDILIAVSNERVSKSRLLDRKYG